MWACVGSSLASTVVVEVRLVRRAPDWLETGMICHAFGISLIGRRWG